MRIHWSKDGSQAYEYITTSNTKTSLNSDKMNVLDGDSLSTANNSVYGDHGIMINFPSQVLLSSFSVKCSVSDVFTIKYSSNSTDGINGTWSTITGFSYNTAQYTNFPISGSCNWIRLLMTTIPYYSAPYFYAFHIFGEYQTPNYEFWNSSKSDKMTGDFPLSLNNVPNTVNSVQQMGFYIKNKESSANSYTLTVNALKYGGDSVITNAIKLSLNGGSTSSNTVTTSSVSGSDFSSLITLCLNLPASANPADGYHYFAIDTVQN